MTSARWSRDEALVEIVRGRLEGLGPGRPDRAGDATRSDRERDRRAAGRA